MTTTIETGSEKGGGMAGKGNVETEIGAGTGAVQGAGIGEKGTVKMESTVGDVIVAALVLEGMVRMVAERNLSRRRKRKKAEGKNVSDPNDPEIIEMNKLQAQLGLKPLK
jgi:hypothetical protein